MSGNLVSWLDWKRAHVHCSAHMIMVRCAPAWRSGCVLMNWCRCLSTTSIGARQNSVSVLTGLQLVLWTHLEPTPVTYGFSSLLWSFVSFALLNLWLNWSSPLTTAGSPPGAAVPLADAPGLMFCWIFLVCFFNPRLYYQHYQHLHSSCPLALSVPFPEVFSWARNTREASGM